ncbi:MAG: phospholipase, partial [Deltaproteobacteria bacterium]|nr:phospholipase [Deltaproteobacteria bacterium]
MIFQTVSAQIGLFQKSYFVQGTDTLPLRILYPDGFDESKSYPVVLLLHGMGERGNDNELQLKHGGKFFSSPETR